MYVYIASTFSIVFSEAKENGSLTIIAKIMSPLKQYLYQIDPSMVTMHTHTHTHTHTHMHIQTHAQLPCMSNNLRSCLNPVSTYIRILS